jgi:hypothetical protein
VHLIHFKVPYQLKDSNYEENVEFQCYSSGFVAKSQKKLSLKAKGSEKLSVASTEASQAM